MNKELEEKISKMKAQLSNPMVIANPSVKKNIEDAIIKFEKEIDKNKLTDKKTETKEEASHNTNPDKIWTKSVMKRLLDRLYKSDITPKEFYDQRVNRFTELYRKEYSAKDAVQEIFIEEKIEYKKPFTKAQKRAHEMVYGNSKPEKEENPSCEELLKKFKDKKEKSRKYHNRPTPTPGKTVEKAAEVAIKKIEDKDGKVSDSDEDKIIKSFEAVIESIKGNKSLIKRIIEKLENLL